MSAQEVRDHVITIFLAGHETTAMAMTWTWFLLSQHPTWSRNCMPNSIAYSAARAHA